MGDTLLILEMRGGRGREEGRGGGREEGRGREGGRKRGREGQEGGRVRRIDEGKEGGEGKGDIHEAVKQ